MSQFTELVAKNFEPGFPTPIAKENIAIKKATMPTEGDCYKGQG